MYPKLLISLMIFAAPVAAESSKPQTIGCDQLLTWIAGGVPNQRLTRLVRERGIHFRINKNTAAALSVAGAETELVSDLLTIPSSGTNSQDTGCGYQFVRAAELVHEQNYEKAEPILRRLVATDRKNADLHFALGYLRQQHNDFDEAFDAYSDAKELEPGFPETHSGLSYVFYRSNDGNNAIAEARTALSIDPQNAEAYRYLGLGLYANENYPAAVHALKESMVRNPKNAEVFYDIGMAQSAAGELSAAAESYRQAIHLNPQFQDAHKNLQTVLRRLGKLDTAAETKQAKRLSPAEAIGPKDPADNKH